MKPLNPCLVSGVVAEIAVTNIDKVDMLFMVDNSNSMKEEQGALRTQFAHLIQVLATGDKRRRHERRSRRRRTCTSASCPATWACSASTASTTAPASATTASCSTRRARTVSGLPGELSVVPQLHRRRERSEQTANDFACIATLGTGGCGFEQQLESPLKALWPSMDPMPDSDGMNRITFLGDAQRPRHLGHGDTDNLGFLRNDPTQGLSLIAIIVVTDEEDCSSSNTKHFTPPTYLDPNDPLASQPLNLRCYYNEKNQNGDELYKLERYVNGFKALRPGQREPGHLRGDHRRAAGPGRHRSTLARVDFTDDGVSATASTRAS